MVMPVFLLSFGVITTVFLSTLWNAGQLAYAKGRKRFGHLAVVTLMISILAMLGLGAPAEIIKVAAGLLIAATIYLYQHERAKHWPVCAIQIVFGLIVLSGLPFILA